jgi:hypothetical protein
MAEYGAPRMQCGRGEAMPLRGGKDFVEEMDGKVPLDLWALCHLCMFHSSRLW